MTKYNFLYIDADEHIGMSKQIECSNDKEALNMAGQEEGEHRAIQVWEGERPVCLVGNARGTGQK